MARFSVFQGFFRKKSQLKEEKERTLKSSKTATMRDHLSTPDNTMCNVLATKSDGRTKTKSPRTSDINTPDNWIQTALATPTDATSTTNARSPRTIENHSKRPDSCRCEGKMNTVLKELSSLRENQEMMMKLFTEQNQTKRASTKIKLHVPAHIRVGVRDGYKSGKDQENDVDWLFSGKNSQNRLKHDSPCNQNLTGYIADYVLGLYGDACRGVIKSAMERYFVSVRDDFHRSASGKSDKHKKRMAISERRKRKQKRRENALKKKTSYSEELQMNIKDILITEFMSSESEVESENEEFLGKKLTWRSQEATRLFMELDKKADELMSSRSRRQRVKCVRGQRVSSRTVPPQVTDKQKWAVVQEQEYIQMCIGSRISLNKIFS